MVAWLSACAGRAEEGPRDHDQGYAACASGAQAIDSARAQIVAGRCDVALVVGALELDWYEDIGRCEPGGAEQLPRSGATALGGRVPVDPSGGLACFGEAIPAQAIARVGELTWQLRGRADGRQVEDARAGIAVNQGLFGHGSAIVAVR